MPMNPSKLLFLFTLVTGTLITISANSWFSAWMGLEINLLSFIPLMMSANNSLSTEASLKYFLIQTLASTILLFSIIVMNIHNQMLTELNVFSSMISISLLLKMGAAPLHFWFPATMEGLNWKNCVILMTWQKIAPLMLMSYLCTPLFMGMTVLCSIIIGSLGGLNQTSLRKLMAYSSINHLGWMLAAMETGENLWLLYFLIYTFLSSAVAFMLHSFQIHHINQSFTMLNNLPVLKFILFTLLLSLGGLPPFLGFLPKWLIIQNLMMTNQPFMTTIMVITTLMTLFYYLRLTFSSFLLSYSEIKWNNMMCYNYMTFTLLMTSSFISSCGLLLCSSLFMVL